MNFRKLIDEHFDQTNSLSQLDRNVTHLVESNQNNLMPSQTSQTYDLLKELLEKPESIALYHFDLIDSLSQFNQNVTDLVESNQNNLMPSQTSPTDGVQRKLLQTPESLASYHFDQTNSLSPLDRNVIDLVGSNENNLMTSHTDGVQRKLLQTPESLVSNHFDQTNSLSPLDRNVIDLVGSNENNLMTSHTSRTDGVQRKLLQTPQSLASYHFDQTNSLSPLNRNVIYLVGSNENNLMPSQTSQTDGVQRKLLQTPESLASYHFYQTNSLSPLNQNVIYLVGSNENNLMPSQTSQTDGVQRKLLQTPESLASYHFDQTNSLSPLDRNVTHLVGSNENNLMPSQTSGTDGVQRKLLQTPQSFASYHFDQTNSLSPLNRNVIYLVGSNENNLMPSQTSQTDGVQRKLLQTPESLASYHFYQTNSLSPLNQNVIYLVGSNENNLMPSQTSRTDGVQTKLLETPESLASYHFAAQNQNMRPPTLTREYQNQYQLQPNYNNPHQESNVQYYGNITNNSLAQGFEYMSSLPPHMLVQQKSVTDYLYPPNQMQVTADYESESPSLEDSFPDLEDAVDIENLVQVEDLVQPLFIRLSPEKEKKKIQEYSNAKHFTEIMENILSKYREQQWNRKYPNQRYNKVTQKDILYPKAYSCIPNNPVRGVFNPSNKGDLALTNGCYSNSLLYYDEALKRKHPARIWYKLSIVLHKMNRDDEAISAAKKLLQYLPNNFEGIQILCTIYNNYRCYYQVCQTVFNWLNNNACYSYVIPPGVTMEDRNTVELDENHLEYVKAIYKLAGKLNPKRTDTKLQVMMGWLHRISKNYAKAAAYQRTAINSVSKRYRSILMNHLGFSLFHDDKPIEALNVFLEGATLAKSDILISYTNIGYVYMYLKKYKESIYYFKKALRPEFLQHSPEFQLQGNAVEDEYDLCIRLYCKLFDV